MEIYQIFMIAILIKNHENLVDLQKISNESMGIL